MSPEREYAGHSGRLKTVWPARKQQPQFGFKDGVTIAMSLVALIVSGFTAWFNIVRQVDDLSIVAPDFIVAFRKDAKHMVFLNDDLRVAFINSGNRAALILGVQVTFIQPAKTSVGTCGGNKINSMNIYSTSFEPTVVKPNDVTAKTFRITQEYLEGTKPDKQGAMTFEIVGDGVAESAVPIEVCLDVTFATPSQSRDDISIPQVKYRASIASGGMGINLDLKAMETRKVTPHQLVKRVGYNFGF